MTARRAIVVALLAELLLAVALPAGAETRAPTRLIVLKFDGLPPDLIAHHVAETNAITGRSRLPWIKHLFFERGVRFENFYSRGMSLSATSWCVLDTGQPSVINGNFEIDRHTGWTADFLDFARYYVDVWRGRRIYPPGVEILDTCGVRLLSDGFVFEERETGMQLHRRGTKFHDMLDVGLEPFRGSIVNKITRALVGVDYHRAWDAVTLERFLEAVRDPAIRYADYYNANVDHVLHDDSSPEAVRNVLEEVDRTIGHAYAALLDSGTADRTVFVVVSDHGLTLPPPGVYSQGLNLVSYLTREEYGAHHILTREEPRTAFSFDGSIFRPWPRPTHVSVPREPVFSPETVTCTLDFDGNERVQAQFRHPDLQRLHLLLVAARRLDRMDARREAAAAAGLAILQRHRDEWAREAAELAVELAELRASLVDTRRELALLESRCERDREREKDGLRVLDLPPFGGRSPVNSRSSVTDTRELARLAKVRIWRDSKLLEQYEAYLQALRRRVATTSTVALLNTKPADLLPSTDLGPPLSARDLCSYPVAIRGLQLDHEGRLDLQATFVEKDYFRVLTGLAVANVASSALADHPVDFTAARLPLEVARSQAARLGNYPSGDVDGITAAYLVDGGKRGALLLFEQGPVQKIAVLPVRRAAVGTLQFEAETWRPGLPLGLFEDPGLGVAPADRKTWLGTFHTATEWFAATHATQCGLAVAGLPEVLAAHDVTAVERRMATAASERDRMLLKFELRRRRAVATDLFVHAAPYWNFDAKDFNPGGNHGGFRRESMHGTLMMIGGRQTSIRNVPTVVYAPYDGLDYGPTLFEAAGLTSAGVLDERLVRWGFRPFPGRVATEAFREVEAARGSP